MARVTIEDCLEKVPNRFQLIHMVAKRVRQIREGSEYLVHSPKNEDVVVALREIAAEKVIAKECSEEEIEISTEEAPIEASKEEKITEEKTSEVTEDVDVIDEVDAIDKSEETEPE